MCYQPMNINSVCEKTIAVDLAGVGLGTCKNLGRATCILAVD